MVLSESIHSNMTETMILHIDADAFFVACEVARLPHLKGTPVVVGEERGIACAMNYEAKALGITRAMPIFQIRKLYKNVTVLPSHFELYRAYQQHLAKILRNRFANVEVYSIDECFIEVSEEEMHFSESALRELKVRIEESLGINYTLGLARTKTLAKLASRSAKPNGVKYLRTEDELSLLKDVRAGDVWGIGRALSKSLGYKAIKTAYDFVLMDDRVLSKEFSVMLYNTKRELLGEKKNSISGNYIDQQSMQVTRSFPLTEDIPYVLSELSLNITSVTRELRSHNLCTRHISLYVKVPDQSRYGKKLWYECMVPNYTTSEAVIMKLAEPFLAEIRKLKGGCKGTGVWAKGLISQKDVPIDLFGAQAISFEQEKYFHVLDQLKDLHGRRSVMNAASLLASVRRDTATRERNIRSEYIAGLPLPYLGETR